ncbi:hypothetical protein [Pararhodobacter sp.]|uniref:hypothetical protein n=1 Tax=Pararhodobacter sp. TaxID=2127056 RepID=UPI002B0013BD|nr:hypothetical protein [Pararhodobacter sp.]
MRLPLPLAALIIAMLTATAGHAERLIRSASFAGDLCATDTDAETGYDDCATMPGNVGIVGVYDLHLFGLDPQPLGDAIVRITSPDADLYADTARNNPGERFRLRLDGVDFGMLFDASEADEAAISPSLAASVLRNIGAATGTSSPLDLIFVLPHADLLPMVTDGVVSVRFDFRDDENINYIDDLSVLLSYSIAEPVSGATSPAAEIAALTATVAAQTVALENLAAALRALSGSAD